MYIGDNYKSPTTYFEADISGMAKFMLNTENLATFNSVAEDDRVHSIIKDLINTSGDIPDLDFIIESVNWGYGDVHKVDAHVGNTFHIHFLGSEPVTAHISGSVIDLAGKDYKKTMMLLYQHLFRMTKVAALKVVPTLQCIGYFFEGGFNSIEFIEKANEQDLIFINIIMQVFRLKIVSKDNKNKSGYTTTTIEFLT